ncbi:MAG TPA: cyclopropane-fatty-acyl-phospholipid synthase family protein [Stellaceae bacterium]|nr:cyclopropane-fatty-acyl-phospholipid synthase family protein [Stellaceae bacterium]
MLQALLSRLAVGALTVETPSGGRVSFAATAPGPDATIKLHRWRALWRLLIGGDLGFAEAYVDEDWSTPNLKTFLELGARNEAALADAMRGTPLLRAINRLRHLRRGNTRRGSRRNIAAHYDLGNDFYAEWLDGGMTYSSALFTAQTNSLEAAQAAKYHRAADMLSVAGGEKVLEIGCGWGGMAELLARGHGCNVTALTLSQQQRDYAAARMKTAGVASQVDVQLTDYRDIQGTFDRAVSIEMFEAVGEEHWPSYFDMLRRRLAAGGVAVVQIITIAEAKFAEYRRNADFIQRYIFPGGMLPSEGALREQIARAGLFLSGRENFGESYARTLAEWQARFQRAWPRIASFGFPTRFKRTWEYYLAYCEAGFRAGAIDVGLYRIEKPS